MVREVLEFWIYQISFGIKLRNDWKNQEKIEVYINFGRELFNFQTYILSVEMDQIFWLYELW